MKSYTEFFYFEKHTFDFIYYETEELKEVFEFDNETKRLETFYLDVLDRIENGSIKAADLGMRM